MHKTPQKTLKQLADEREDLIERLQKENRFLKNTMESERTTLENELRKEFRRTIITLTREIESLKRDSIEGSSELYHLLEARYGRKVVESLKLELKIKMT